MTVRAIDKQINQYLGRLNPTQKQAVLTVVKTIAGEEYYDHWKDKDFVAELDIRTAEFESGKTKGYTMAQVETDAKKAYKAKQRNKK